MFRWKYAAHWTHFGSDFYLCWCHESIMLSSLGSSLFKFRVDKPSLIFFFTEKTKEFQQILKIGLYEGLVQGWTWGIALCTQQIDGPSCTRWAISILSFDTDCESISPIRIVNSLVVHMIFCNFCVIRTML